MALLSENFKDCRKDTKNAKEKNRRAIEEAQSKIF